MRHRLHIEINNRKYAFEAVFLAVSIVFCILCLSIVLRVHGWPYDDDNIWIKLRTEIYGTQFRHGNLFPVWSSSDAYGMGSPVLLFYQKLFYYVSGALFVLLHGAIKKALVISVGIFMLVGLYGMRFALSVITKRKLSLVVIPQVLILSNYSFTDWFMRGDVSEFSAMMIVPWVFYWCLNLIKNRKPSILIVPIFVLLVLAHNAIAVAATLLVVTSLVVYAYGRWREVVNKELVVRLALYAVLGLLILSPLLIAQYKMSKDFDPSVKILQDDGVPPAHYLTLSGYFLTWYAWLQNNSVLNLQIDYGIWVPILVIIVFLVLCLLFKDRNPFKRALKYFSDKRTLVFLLGSFLIYLFLQLGISKPVYSVLSPLNFLQFPWRLLIFITIAGILVVAYASEWLYRSLKKDWIVSSFVILWLVSFVLLSPIVRKYGPNYAIISTNQFSSAILPSYGGIGEIGTGEYLPKLYTTSGVEINKDQDQAYYNQLFLTNKEGEALNGTCSYSERPNASFETSNVVMTISCNGAATFALPITYSRYLQVQQLDNGIYKPYPFYRLNTDPRAIIRVKNTVTVRVVFPTAAHILLG